ncbi:MAG: aminopeptidase P family protein [Calditrichaeota bacterium]|nr:aminopeptidase P family protein [Calditrichota bacterium]
MKMLLSLCFIFVVHSQEGYPLYQNEFSKAEYSARYAKLFEKIGDNVALIQGAPTPVGYTRFRQYNEFYYLCAIESPHAYLLFDGRNKRVTLYLPHRNEGRERGEGMMISAEDESFITEKTPINSVYGIDLLHEHLVRIARSNTLPLIYTPFSPMEGKSVSRDLALRRDADIQSDPFDGRINRSATFMKLLSERFPHLKLADLTPILDEMRLIKSDEEIAVIRKSTNLSSAAILESMKSVQPGMFEHELDGLAKLIFYRNGAQGDAYYSLIASATNAWYPHYNAGHRLMKDGDFLLMDYAPDYKYYMSDVTRMFPVNGKFSAWQRELYGFYLGCYKAILKHITVGKTAQAIKQEAVKEMKSLLAKSKFSKASYQKAAEDFVSGYDRGAKDPNTGMGHWVGMATHDVGYWKGPLKAGMVFTIEPALRVPEEKIYIRLEDMILITKSGAENMSEDLPMDIDEIEKVMAEDGLLDHNKRID